jgi:hypothetical protein
MSARYYMVGVSMAGRMLIGPDDGYQAETGRPVCNSTFSALPLSSSRGVRKLPAFVLGTHTLIILPTYIILLPLFSQREREEMMYVVATLMEIEYPLAYIILPAYTTFPYTRLTTHSLPSTAAFLGCLHFC